MKHLINYSLLITLTLGFAAFTNAQETTTTTTTITKKEVTENPDGTYSVIEYPVGKEVTVELTPNNIEGAKGWAKIMRMADGTTVSLDLSGLPADAASYYVYAMDNSGKVTLLGPAAVENGISKTTFSTPMNQFMLMLSPDKALSKFDADAPVVFRSTVPTGYAVVPMMTTSVEDNRQVAGSKEVTSTYQVPLLGIPAYEKTAEIRINFSGDLAGLKGKAYVDPTKNGLTKIKMRFDDMKMAPKNKRYILWASAPDGTYTKLGQIINNGERQEAEIRSETALADFGLFVTMEEGDVSAPTSKVYSVFSMK